MGTVFLRGGQPPPAVMLKEGGDREGEACGYQVWRWPHAFGSHSRTPMATPTCQRGWEVQSGRYARRDPLCDQPAASATLRNARKVHETEDAEPERTWEGPRCVFKHWKGLRVTGGGLSLFCVTLKGRSRACG